MIKIYGLNSFAEAMLYYLGKANDSGVKKRLDKAINMYPEHKKALEAAAKPAKALEKLLDAKLTADDALVKKFFKNFEGAEPYTPFGFCIASVMITEPLIHNLKQPVDELLKYLHECSRQERIHSFCLGIADKNEMIFYETAEIDEFLSRLEKLQISAEDKLKIMTAAFAYQKTLDELLSLILPAAKIIEESHDKYNECIREFHNLYSADNARSLIESCFIDKFPILEDMDIIPSVFGFDTRITTINENGNRITFYPGDIFLGVGRHLIGNTTKNEIPALCDKIKALSDTTRLEMLFYLCSHKPYAQELGIKFGLGHSAVSYHITKLLAAGFVTAELSGGKTYYSADKAGIQRMLDSFAEKIK